MIRFAIHKSGNCKRSNMDIKAALFDFDGVIMNTEGQYTLFWDRMGKKYLGVDGYGSIIKGQTLARIFGNDFSGMEKEQAEIESMLDRFEAEMPYRFIPGLPDFFIELRSMGIMTAVVTSSSDKKMQNIYRACPDFPSFVDRIFTSESFRRSKPAPDCFLLAMDTFGVSAEETVIFEDSFYGLEAARASGGFVVGLATTNPREVIADKADMVIDDFAGFDISQVQAYRYRL